MRKKDYKAIATILRAVVSNPPATGSLSTRLEVAREVVGGLSALFRANDPRFKPHLFREDCGFLSRSVQQ